MPVNARTAELSPLHKILVVGDAGAGKTAQIATLPGKKFVYAFDPNTLPLLITRKVDADVEEFLPDVASVDFTLKGFNKGAVDDKPRRKNLEPRCYMNWEENFNTLFDNGSFDAYNWICFDSLTLFTQALMNRNLFINNRFGDIEEQSDYRIVGNKMTQTFTAIASMKKNIYATAHTQTFQDEKTQRITTQLALPGKSRDMLPKLFSNIWLLQAANDAKAGYTMLTRAEPRGFQSIRTVIPNLQPVEDVTIDWNKPEESGIGAILSGKRRAVATPVAARPTPTPAIAKPQPSLSGAPTAVSTQPAPK